MSEHPNSSEMITDTDELVERCKTPQLRSNPNLVMDITPQKPANLMQSPEICTEAFGTKKVEQVQSTPSMH